MTEPRHQMALQKAVRLLKARLVLPALAATIVTGSVVGVSVAALDDSPQIAAAARADVEPIKVSLPDGALAERLEDRRQMVSRAARRVTIEEKPVPTGHRFTTAPLNLRVKPADRAKVVTVIAEGSRIAITGDRTKGFAEVVRDRKAFWVSAEYLSKTKPKPEPEPEVETVEEAAAPAAPAAPAGGTCTAAPPSGVTSSAMAVYRAVCSAFPSIRTYGGWRGDGEHSGGQAIDIMVSGDLGWQVANYLRANAGRFGLYDVIYAQRIWTAQRSAEGWRSMSDRGSPTANHYDHVHVKVF